MEPRGGHALKQKQGPKNQLPLFPELVGGGGGLRPACLGILPSIVLSVDFVVMRQVLTNIPSPFGLESCKASCLETQPHSLGSHN